MDNLLEFKCTGEAAQIIPEDIININGLNYTDIHRDKSAMAIAAKEIKKLSCDSLCKLPFCTTVEAEAFGGCIKLGDINSGPRIEKYVFSAFEDLENIGKFNFEEGRIGAVLNAAEALNNEGELVVLNIEGPFTIISSLIEPVVFYKALKKNKALAVRIISTIEDSIVDYMIEAIKRGVRIISFADPMGTVEILGPKIYEEFSASCTYNILKRIKPFLNDCIIHLCGKITSAFETIGLSKSEAIYLEAEMTYGEALISTLKYRKDIKIIGNSCIRRTSIKFANAVIWETKLFK